MSEYIILKDVRDSETPFCLKISINDLLFWYGSVTFVNNRQLNYIIISSKTNLDRLAVHVAKLLKLLEH